MVKKNDPTSERKVEPIQSCWWSYRSPYIGACNETPKQLKGLTAWKIKKRNAKKLTPDESTTPERNKEVLAPLEVIMVLKKNPEEKLKSKKARRCNGLFSLKYGGENSPVEVSSRIVIWTKKSYLYTKIKNGLHSTILLVAPWGDTGWQSWRGDQNQEDDYLNAISSHRKNCSLR